MSATLKAKTQEQKPVAGLEEQAFLNLMRAYGTLSQGHDRFLKGYRLTPVMYNILRILRDAGESGLRCSDMAKRMLTRVPDVTRLVDRLVSRDFVERRRTERDRRLVLLTLTSKGRALLKEMDEPLKALVVGQFDHLADGELAELNDLLVKAGNKHADAEPLAN